MRNTLDDIEKAISNTRKAIANLIAQQNQCQNQYTETKIASQSAHDEALKAAYNGDSSLAIKALSQEVIQEKIATLLNSQIKEQLTTIELLNNNLSILNNIKFALVKCLQNEPSQNKNTQSLAANSRREYTRKDLYSNELSSEDLLIERVKKVISEKESIEVENISLVHSLVLGGTFGSFLSSSTNYDIPPNDLNMDNLDAIELLMAIEEEFDIEISDAEAEMVRTVQELVNIISFKLS